MDPIEANISSTNNTHKYIESGYETKEFHRTLTCNEKKKKSCD